MALFPLFVDAVRATQLLKFLADATGWEYEKDAWTREDLRLLRLQKSIVKPTQKNYDDVLSRDPFSFAITGSTRLEFTLYHLR